MKPQRRVSRVAVVITTGFRPFTELLALDAFLGVVPVLAFLDDEFFPAQCRRHAR